MQSRIFPLYVHEGVNIHVSSSSYDLLEDPCSVAVNSYQATLLPCRFQSTHTSTSAQKMEGETKNKKHLNENERGQRMYHPPYPLFPKKGHFGTNRSADGYVEHRIAFCPALCSLLTFTQHLHVSKALYQHLLILTTSL